MKWNPAKLGDLISLEYGKPLPRSTRDESGSVPVAGSNGSDGTHSVALVEGPGIVVGRKGSAGKVTWFGNGFWPIDTTYFVKHDPQVTDLRWLYYLLKGKKLDRLNKTTGVPGLNRNDAYVERCLLPPPSEQHRMVELLDEADRLRKLRREADAKAARILPALFLKMFGDPATNPMGWQETTIGDVISSSDYGSSTRSSDDGVGIPLIRMGNVDYAGHLDLSDLKHVQLSETESVRYRLESGDILFNRTNSKELVGKTGLWDASIDAVLASYFIRLRVDRSLMEPTFLWALMNGSHMKRVLRSTARGAIGQANINSTELRAFAVYRPPLERQALFGKRWQAIRATLPSRADESDLDSLFSALLQRAFSGQLTAKWREAHMKELLAEMEQQARLLNLPQAEAASA